jgi:hypothetical protein
MATRDDHVITISYPDGTTIVEHADGTRITTYYRENQITRSGEESYEGKMLSLIIVDSQNNNNIL